jgi:hypothetical protein
MTCTKSPKDLNMDNPLQAEGAARGIEANAARGIEASAARGIEAGAARGIGERRSSVHPQPDDDYNSVNQSQKSYQSKKIPLQTNPELRLRLASGYLYLSPSDFCDC